MALTTLDAASALVVIDLQKGSVGLPIAGVIANAAALCAAFRRHRLPVMLVRVTGAAGGRTEQAPRLGEPAPDWAELVPELNRQPSDHTVTKRSWGAFTATDLEAQLRGRGVTQLVVAGVATSVGVRSTARHAHKLGFNVTLALDAITDPSPEAHGHSLARIFPRLGETGTTGQIVALLDPRA